jgi:excisionase family DNA binding protein
MAEIEAPMLLTIREVARLIGVSVPRTYEMVAAGVLPSVRLSARRLRVPRHALEAWIDEQTEKALAGVSQGGDGDES